MSSSLLSKVRVLALAAAMVLSGAVGTLLIAGSNAVPASAVAPPAGPQPAGLDHFLCYNAVSLKSPKGLPKFKIPKGVVLFNQLAPKGFTPKISKTLAAHCNPATKIVPGAVFAAMSPSWHLLCFQISKAPAPISPTATVSNQFSPTAPVHLALKAPTSLCLPSLKSLKTPPVFSPPGPNEIMPDHFTCYPATYAPGSPPFTPPPVQVLDQFAPAPVSVQIGNPTLLCVPTKKVVAGKTYPITNPQAHLVCFAVTQTPIISPVWDENQFGVGELAIRSTSTLCLPSFKTIP